ncbi:two-component sensor histidine kinase [Xylanimonas oleitrophica]|uniref:Sensor histidine kinase MtrB n=2 Tax=Xylanimonas oleitrophica TaxID=2607479 RepID=A0A2W5Y220_9MICO|nr:MtrAB system histidine kinase MtrB [Xylanimonas oleitrophica]PZR51544.1 two-component sensor histidine kinase [Xylanimonas oleitrophica]
MQARVITSALAIGVVAVAVIGTFLSTSIRDGLYDQRVQQLSAESTRASAQVRESFSSSPSTSTADVQALLLQTVARLQGGASSADGAFLLSAGDAASAGLNAVGSPQGLVSLVTPELRDATIDSEHQTWQSVQIPAAYTASGHPEPGVVFGSVVEPPSAGRFGMYLLYSLQPEQDTLRFVQRTLMLGGAAILALVGAITWLVTRQAVTPVRRAAATAARLADGHLSERMPGKGHDEMATLARSFNEMASSLQDQIRRMEDLSTAQRRFVSDVSHELRTPLTTIRMASEVIHASRDELDPAARRSAELLQTQLDRFEELLADLLEISRFDAGAAVLDVEQRDLAGIVAAVVDTATPLAERKGVFLSVELPDQPATADVDPRRVERILRNLVVNAVEHAEGGPVEITVGGDDRAVAVVVRDHGVGMTPQEVAHVFDRFWRADPARARTTGGSGLGLAIALEDARLHAGRLEAWGRPGQGASFRLTLPRRAGIRLEEPPLPLVPEPRGLASVRTGQIPVVNPPTGPTPSAIPDLAELPLEEPADGMEVPR